MTTRIDASENRQTVEWIARLLAKAAQRGWENREQRASRCENSEPDGANEAGNWPKSFKNTGH